MKKNLYSALDIATSFEIAAISLLRDLDTDKSISEQTGLIRHDVLGPLCGAIVLSSLSIEIALKSLLEKHGITFPKKHDHIILFNLIPMPIQLMLQDRFYVTAVNYNQNGPTDLREVLESTRDSFIQWRYIHEASKLIKIDISSVLIAAKVIAAESGAV